MATPSTRRGARPPARRGGRAHVYPPLRRSPRDRRPRHARFRNPRAGARRRSHPDPGRRRWIARRHGHRPAGAEARPGDHRRGAGQCRLLRRRFRSRTPVRVPNRFTLADGLAVAEAGHAYPGHRARRSRRVSSRSARNPSPSPCSGWPNSTNASSKVPAPPGWLPCSMAAARLAGTPRRDPAHRREHRSTRPQPGHRTRSRGRRPHLPLRRADQRSPRWPRASPPAVLADAGANVTEIVHNRTFAGPTYPASTSSVPSSTRDRVAHRRSATTPASPTTVWNSAGATTPNGRNASGFLTEVRTTLFWKRRGEFRGSGAPRCIRPLLRWRTPTPSSPNAYPSMKISSLFRSVAHESRSVAHETGAACHETQFFAEIPRSAGPEFTFRRSRSWFRRSRNIVRVPRIGDFRSRIAVPPLTNHVPSLTKHVPSLTKHHPSATAQGIRAAEWQLPTFDSQS